MEPVITSAIIFCMLFGAQCEPCKIQLDRKILHETCCCDGAAVDWGDVPVVKPKLKVMAQVAEPRDLDTTNH